MSFRIAFPKTRVLNKSIGCYCVDRIREAGSVDSKKRSDRPSLLTDEMMTNVLI